jgi:hypothetical protein
LFIVVRCFLTVNQALFNGVIIPDIGGGKKPVGKKRAKNAEKPEVLIKIIGKKRKTG